MYGLGYVRMRQSFGFYMVVPVELWVSGYISMVRVMFLFDVSGLLTAYNALQRHRTKVGLSTIL